MGIIVAFKRLQWFDKAKVVWWLFVTAFVAPPWLWVSVLLMRLNMRVLDNGFDIGPFFSSILLALLTVLFIAGASAPLYAALNILRHPK